VQECDLVRTYIVKVKFDPSGQFMVDETTMEIKVSLRCVPVKGKANRELINTISKHLDIILQILR
jgi:uncharacterized protein YggU (UPF0235/DUF167 family)